ncbi:MAG: hypothetical protein ACE1ZV_03780, partial [Alphaproteobacteria bacterium]
MEDHQTLIGEIEQYCRARTIAESTFGRMAVNDGKFVGRLRSGKGVTTRTITRVREFIAADAGTLQAARATDAAQIIEMPPGDNGGQTQPPAPVNGSRRRAFRFYDNRQKYLTFVNTCSEKWVVAERVGLELAQIRPRPPAIR